MYTESQYTSYKEPKMAGFDSKALADVLENDAARWERMVAYLQSVQAGKANLSAFSAKAVEKTLEHAKGLRAIAAEVYHPTSPAHEKPVTNRTNLLELD